MSADDDVWPRWSEGASRGDLIRVIIRQQSINTALARAILLSLESDERATRLALNDYFIEHAKLSKLIDQLGGSDDD